MAALQSRDVLIVWQRGEWAGDLLGFPTAVTFQQTHSHFLLPRFPRSLCHA
jgi:hypothetical protein